MIKIVVLDFDGVIVDSNALKQRAFFELFPLDDKITSLISAVLSRRYRLVTRFEILRDILEGLGKGGEEVESLVPAYAAEYNARIQRGILALGISAEVEKALGLLCDRYHLYINSGTYAPGLLESVENLGISHFFKKVCGRPPSKTDNLKNILTTEDANGREIVVVGDGEEDYDSARALNCHFIAIANGFTAWQEGSFPVIRNLAGSPELIASLNIPNRP